MALQSILKEVRLLRGLPIAAVAVRAKVGPGTIVAIERHGHVPRAETQVKLARALGVDVRKIWPTADQTDSPTAA